MTPLDHVRADLTELLRLLDKIGPMLALLEGYRTEKPVAAAPAAGDNLPPATQAPRQGDGVPRLCEVCGEMFTAAGRGNQRYCGLPCRRRAADARAAAARKAAKAPKGKPPVAPAELHEQRPTVAWNRFADDPARAAYLKPPPLGIPEIDDRPS